MIHRKQIRQITMEHLRRKGHFKLSAEKRGKFNDDGRIDQKRRSKYGFVTLEEHKARCYIALFLSDRKPGRICNFSNY